MRCTVILPHPPVAVSFVVFVFKLVLFILFRNLLRNAQEKPTTLYKAAGELFSLLRIYEASNAHWRQQSGKEDLPEATGEATEMGWGRAVWRYLEEHFSKDCLSIWWFILEKT